MMSDEELARESVSASPLVAADVKPCFRQAVLVLVRSVSYRSKIITTFVIVIVETTGLAQNLGSFTHRNIGSDKAKCDSLLSGDKSNEDGGEVFLRGIYLVSPKTSTFLLFE